MPDELSPKAQAIIDAAIQAANEDGLEATDKAVDNAIFELSLSLPQGKKTEVIDTLKEIAKAYAQLRAMRDPVVGSFKAIVSRQANYSSACVLTLEKPVRGVKYAVMSTETKGFVSFWNRLGKDDPVGAEVTILKMSRGPDAFEVEEIAKQE